MVGQQAVGEKRNWSGTSPSMDAVAGLLGQLDLEGRVVTGDAQFTHGARECVSAGGSPRGHYFFAVKGNQPTLLEDITAIWEGEPEPAQATQVDQHGGRIEQRRLWVSQLLVGGYSDWPHLAQVCRLERIVRTKGKRTQGWRPDGSRPTP